ncbi:hypothetical protein ABW19_dt0205001 [Dactylella cylindrospora]|nr:hypothetical protein ABW19_dt0205001 [Dactylella cylindrospora]
MIEEQDRVLQAILKELDAWAFLIFSLRKGQSARCTCSRVEDCVPIARELFITLKSWELVETDHELGLRYRRGDQSTKHTPKVTWKGSILDIMQILVPTAAAIPRAVIYRPGTCQVYDSLKKLIEGVDNIVGNIRGVHHYGKFATRRFNGGDSEHLESSSTHTLLDTLEGRFVGVARLGVF